MLSRELVFEAFRQLYAFGQTAVKEASDATKVHALSGQLYLSKSGWILLDVPNSLVRGAFDALNVPGAELPTKHSGKLVAHISVIRPEELEQIGGPDVITERGHHFHYTTGPVKEVQPAGWPEMSKVWFIEVKSPELEALRKSYGLSGTPKDGKHEFHITIAVRKKKVLQANDIKKAASALMIKAAGKITVEAIQKAMVGKDLAGIYVYHNEDSNVVVIDIMDWGDEATGKVLGAVAARCVGKDHVIYHNEQPPLKSNGWKEIKPVEKRSEHRIVRTELPIVYMEPKGDNPQFAQCGTCHHFTGSSCLIFAPGDHIVAGGSCKEYKEGPPQPDKVGQETSHMTPAQAGYVVRQVRCENCISFDAVVSKCKRYEKYNKEEPGSYNLDENVIPHACCNWQEPKVIKEGLARKFLCKDAGGAQMLLMSSLDDIMMAWMARRRRQQAAAQPTQTPEAQPAAETATEPSLKLDPNAGAEKLSAEEKKHIPTVAVDMDGTLVEYDGWKGDDHFGKVRRGVVKAMKEFQRLGWRIIIWTVRGAVQKVKDFLHQNDIPYDYINENPDQPDGSSDKVRADVYIDDRGVDARKPWHKILAETKDRIKAASCLTSDEVWAWLVVENEKQAASAEGIPDRSVYGNLSEVQPGQLYDWVVQHHKAHRAGPHYDVRFGGPSTGLFSWAARKGLPTPGQKHLAVQQPLHSHGYKDFEGKIEHGYGAGDVKTHEKGQVLVTKVHPNEIHFTTARSRYPERFVLKHTGDKNWLLINATKTEAIPHEKVHYKKIEPHKAEEILHKLQPGSSVQAKIDGAASLTKLYKDHFEVVSYRAAKNTGHPLVHTERVFHGRPQVKIPKALQGLVLRGELYGVSRGGKAIRPQTLGGLLNAGIAKSIGEQKRHGISLRQLVFDVDRDPARERDGDSAARLHETTPYSERRLRVEEALKHLPTNHFHGPEEATTPKGALELWKRIAGGKHPLTHEGVVVHPPTGVPWKSKLHEEHDVHIREFFPGEGKLKGTGIGGFRYSHEPKGPIAGEVGTGFSDALRRQMHEDPAAFLGRVAKVRAQEKFPSGALRAPALIGLHEDYPLAKTGAELPEGTPALVRLSLRGGAQIICPRCGKPIKHDLYTDKKGWKFHRSCFNKGKGPVKED